MTSVAAERPRRASRISVWLLGFATAGILAYSWWGTDWHYRIGVPVPYRRIAVPVLWWGVFACYFAAGRRWYGRGVVGAAVVIDAVVLHLEWALVSFYLQHGYSDLVGRLYTWYITAAILAFTGIAAWRAGRAAALVRTEPTMALRVPLVVGTAIAVGVLLFAGEWLLSLLLCAAGAGGYVFVRSTAGARAAGRMHSFVGRLRAHDRLALAAVIVLAVGLRLAWYVHLVRLVGFGYRTGFLAASDDGQTYHTTAVKLASDPSLFFAESNPATAEQFDPLYSVLLAFWYMATGVAYTPAVIVQCLLGAIPVAVAYALAKRLSDGSKAAGLVAALFVALSQPLISFSAMYGIEALYIPVLSLWVWAAWQYAERGGARALGIMGAAGGAILGLRRFGLFFLLALLPWMLWAGRKRGALAAARAWTGVAVLATLVYLPVEMMYFRTGQGRLTALSANVSKDSVWAQKSPFPDVVPDNRRLIAVGLDPARPVQSLQAAFNRPVEVGAALWAVVPVRVLAFFFWPPFGQFDSIVLVNPRFPNRFTPVAEFYLVFAALLGICLTLINRATRQLAALLLIVIAVQAFASAGISLTASVRYSAPVRPLLMAFAAAGVVLVSRKFADDSR